MSELSYCNCRTVIALGTFDGVHIGHRMLINNVLDLAQKNSAIPMVYTFKNHPLSIIGKAPELILTADERNEEIEKCGIDNIYCVEFNKEYASILPYDFIKMIVESFKPIAIVVGFNYTFGKNGKGNVDTLKKYEDELGYKLYVVDEVRLGNVTVSSSAIRRLLKAGDIKNVNKMLGRNYTLSGCVVKNKQIGRTIGFPTANIETDKQKVLPSYGVYETRTIYNGKTYNSITNIGNNPTVNGEKTTIETHIIDFSGDIYGKTIAVDFIDRIRGEIKFNSIEDVKEQIKKDIKSICK